jgi:hypothetical protein
MKSELIAGDTLQFTTSVPDYPASAGWTLTYRLVPRTSGSAISFDATADGDDYDIEVGASTTDDWTAGEYSWSAYVSKAGERHTVDQGTVKIQPNPGVVAAYDARSFARKALDAIEAVLEGRASKDQEEYSIGGRSLKRTKLEDLHKMRARFKAEVDAEDRAAAGRAHKLVVRL